MTLNTRRHVSGLITASFKLKREHRSIMFALHTRTTTSQNYTYTPAIGDL
jgi:hypothetical protein